ncbi:MAG TPA: DUF1501 domain-containing protein [Prosthecobacter sp.]|nr:DUF1501 domain-containing protein [Prosthecobacter sp.]
MMHTFSRRHLLQSSSAGFGWLAFNALHQQWAAAAAPPKTINPLAPKPPHFEPKAKRVIFMFMQGGPSHLDTFDWKPELAKAEEQKIQKYMGSAFKFAPRGKSGLMISDAFPNLAKHADDLCLLNGMRTATNAHQMATVALHIGSETFVRPSMGAWIVYGLGTEAEDLPGFVTINPVSDTGGAMNYGSAFLPATFQGTRLSSAGGGVADLTNNHLSDADQRRQIEFIQKANRRLLGQDPGNPEIEGVIQSYELAYKMQTSVPATLDLNAEPAHIHSLYGLDNPETERFGTQCLMARRLAEKGVRFIQLTSPGWDHHNGLRENLARQCTSIDQPIAGLIADLKQRDMLKDTLILWGGEFGRGSGYDNELYNGRGHNGGGYTMWMAGGGVKGGFAYGSTNAMGDTAESGIIGTHDLHATVLHLLGINHERLTYKYAGRNFRLTDVEGVVAKDIIA